MAWARNRLLLGLLIALTVLMGGRPLPTLGGGKDPLTCVDRLATAGEKGVVAPPTGLTPNSVSLFERILNFLHRTSERQVGDRLELFQDARFSSTHDFFVIVARGWIKPLKQYVPENQVRELLKAFKECLQDYLQEALKPYLSSSHPWAIYSNYALFAVGVPKNALPVADLHKAYISAVEDWVVRHFAPAIAIALERMPERERRSASETLKQQLPTEDKLFTANGGPSFNWAYFSARSWNMKTTVLDVQQELDRVEVLRRSLWAFIQGHLENGPVPGRASMIVETPILDDHQEISSVDTLSPEFWALVRVSKPDAQFVEAVNRRFGTTLSYSDKATREFVQKVFEYLFILGHFDPPLFSLDAHYSVEAPIEGSDAMETRVANSEMSMSADIIGAGARHLSSIEAFVAEGLPMDEHSIVPEPIARKKIERLQGARGVSQKRFNEIYALLVDIGAKVGGTPEFPRSGDEFVVYRRKAFKDPKLRALVRGQPVLTLDRARTPIVDHRGQNGTRLLTKDVLNLRTIADRYHKRVASRALDEDPKLAEKTVLQVVVRVEGDFHSEKAKIIVRAYYRSLDPHVEPKIAPLLRLVMEEMKSEAEEMRNLSLEIIPVND